MGNFPSFACSQESTWLFNHAMLQKINNLLDRTIVTNSVPAESAAEKPPMLRLCNTTSHKIPRKYADKSNWSGCADPAVLPPVFFGAIYSHG
jgi:hypothetical protein